MTLQTVFWICQYSNSRQWISFVETENIFQIYKEMLNHIVISLGFFSMVATWDLTLLHVNDIHMRMEETNKYSSNCKQKDMKAGEYTIIW